MLCCVPGCNNRSGKASTAKKISFFNLPKDQSKLKVLLIKIRRDLGPNFAVTRYTKICSEHYTSDDFNFHYTGRKTLKPEALPSTFNWSNKKTKRKSPGKKNITRTVRAVDDSTALAATREICVTPSEAVNVSEDIDDRHESNQLHTSDSALSVTVSVPVEDTMAELTEPPLSGSVEMENLTGGSSADEAEKGIQNLSLMVDSLQQQVAKLEALLQEKEALLRTISAALDKEKDEKVALLEALKDSRASNDSYKVQLNDMMKKQFSFQNIKRDNMAVRFYTGMESEEQFLALHTFLDPGQWGENIRQWRGPSGTYDASSRQQSGRHSTLCSEDQLLLVFCRLRLNLLEIDLGQRFGISQSTVSRVLSSWINYMYLRLGSLQIWPPKDYIVETMPQCFKEKYPTTRVIIDATELKCQNPKSFMNKSSLFSHYKGTYTFKGLLGIAPNGLVTFVSALYSGSTSDRQLTASCGILDQEYQNGDSIMADKGFDIDDILPEGVTLNIPPFLQSGRQFTLEEIRKTQDIASVRIHVERRIARIKAFRILSSIIPQTLSPLINQIWTICAIVSNFQSQIILDPKVSPLEPCILLDCNEEEAEEL